MSNWQDLPEETETVSLSEMFSEDFFKQEVNVSKFLEEKSASQPKITYPNNLYYMKSENTFEIKIFPHSKAKNPMDFYESYLSYFKDNPNPSEKSIILALILSSDNDKVPVNTEQAVYLQIPSQGIEQISRLMTKRKYKLTHPVSKTISIFYGKIDGKYKFIAEPIDSDFDSTVSDIKFPTISIFDLIQKETERNKEK